MTLDPLDGRDSATAVEATVEAAVERFENAWQGNVQPQLDEHLLNVGLYRGAILRELVAIDLEYRLKQGQSARVEEYILQYPELADDETYCQLLVAQEYLLRQQFNPALQFDEYETRFPQFETDLRQNIAAFVPRKNRPRLRFAARLNCPHCHNPIEIVTESKEDDVMCPSCGSAVHLDTGRSLTWNKRRLPQIAHFELIEAVGRGAFGTVYKARDLQLKRIVAIKIPRSGVLETDDDEDRFVREARNVAQLSHPGIVSIHSVGRSDSFPYLVSEFVEGMTLAQFLTAKRFNVRDSAKLIREISIALQHAHEQGVVHRDLKPSNIMLTADHKPLLMDFGFAKRDAGEITMTLDGQILGTPAYMSPEQAHGDAHRADARSDIYSVGTILFQLLTAELPFRGDVRMLLHQVQHDEPPAPRKLNHLIPRDLDTICVKCLAKEPKRRYGSASDLGDDLQRYLDGKPIFARPISQAERAWPWCRRNPVVASLSSTTVLLLALTAAISTAAYLRESAYLAQAQQDKETMGILESKASKKADDYLRLAEKEQSARMTADVYAILKTYEAWRRTYEAWRATYEAWRANQAANAAIAAEKKAGDEAKAARAAEKVSEEVLEFLTHGLVGPNSPFESTKPNILLRDALVPAVNELENGSLGKEGADQKVKASIHHALGYVYLGMGEYKLAEKHINEALKIRKTFGEDAPETLQTENNKALLLVHQERYGEAETIFNRLLDVYKIKLGGEKCREALQMRHNLANVHLRIAQANRPGAAGPLLADDFDKLEDEFISVGRDRLAEFLGQDPDTLESFNSLGALFQIQGNHAKALTAFLFAYNHRYTNDPQSPEALTTADNLGRLYISMGDAETENELKLKCYKRAKGYFSNAFNGRQSILRLSHPDTFVSFSNLADCNCRLKEYDDLLVHLCLIRDHWDQFFSLDDSDEEKQQNRVLVNNLALACLECAAADSTLPTKKSEYYELAERMLLKSLDDPKVAVAEGSETDVATHRNLGQVYISRQNQLVRDDDFANAVKYLRLAYDKSVALGTETVSSIEIKFEKVLAEYCQIIPSGSEKNNQEKIGEVEKLRKARDLILEMDEILKVAKVKFGPDHSTTKDIEEKIKIIKTPQTRKGR